MKPTNKLAHFSHGGNSVLGLPVSVDDQGAEFVNHQDQWVHVSEMPFRRLDRPGEIDNQGAVERTPELHPHGTRTRRAPQFVITPPAPNIPAFQPTTMEQQAPAGPSPTITQPHWNTKKNPRGPF